MVGERRARVLDLGSGDGTFVSMLRTAGHEVFCIDRSAEAMALLSERHGSRLSVAGQVEALPFLACNFDVVTASQTLHRFAPGLALSEIARVLKPSGHLAVAYNSRDDTVPWVKRLVALLQQADPDSLATDVGPQAVRAVSDSPFFGDVERKAFRNWVPTTRAGLVAMVERRPSTAKLEPDVREGLLRAVGELYDSSARAPEPLLLPIQATCWRAPVDHSQLALIDDDLDALEIPI